MVNFYPARNTALFFGIRNLVLSSDILIYYFYQLGKDIYSQCPDKENNENV